jgi:hypothetical protein
MGLLSGGVLIPLLDHQLTIYTSTHQVATATPRMMISLSACDDLDDESRQIRLG